MSLLSVKQKDTPRHASAAPLLVLRALYDTQTPKEAIKHGLTVYI